MGTQDSAVVTITTQNITGFDVYGNPVSDHAVEVEKMYFDALEEAIEGLDPFQCYGLGGLAYNKT